MKKTILILFSIVFFVTVYSCKKKTCPAYDENQKEEYKIKPNAKHKKERMY